MGPIEKRMREMIEERRQSETDRLRARLRESVAKGLERSHPNWWAQARGCRLLRHYARLIREHKEPAWVTKAIEG